MTNRRDHRSSTYTVFTTALVAVFLAAGLPAGAESASNEPEATIGIEALEDRSVFTYRCIPGLYYGNCHAHTLAVSAAATASGLLPGNYDAVVELLDEQGATIASASCSFLAPVESGCGAATEAVSTTKYTFNDGTACFGYSVRATLTSSLGAITGAPAATASDSFAPCVGDPGHGIGEANKLFGGERLYGVDGEQYIVSPSGNAQMRMQGDGKINVYQWGGDSYSISRWSTTTYGSGATHVEMGADGNLVLYDDDRNPKWSSQTNGNPGAYLEIQDDCNLVIYAPAGHALWASGVGCQ